MLPEGGPARVILRELRLVELRLEEMFLSKNPNESAVGRIVGVDVGVDGELDDRSRQRLLSPRFAMDNFVLNLQQIAK